MFTAPITLREVTVVVDNDTVPVAVRVPVVRDVDVALPNVEVPDVSVLISAFVAVRLVKNPVSDVISDEKKLDAVVVASVVVPLTVRLPCVITLPYASTAKLALGVQDDPSQKSV